VRLPPSPPREDRAGERSPILLVLDLDLVLFFRSIMRPKLLVHGKEAAA
jgi:hypothetical protein